MNLLKLKSMLESESVAFAVCAALFKRRKTVERCASILANVCRNGGVAPKRDFYIHGAYIPLVLRRHGLIILIRNSWNRYSYLVASCGVHGALQEPRFFVRIVEELVKNTVPKRVMRKLKRRAREKGDIELEECTSITVREIERQTEPLLKIIKAISKDSYSSIKREFIEAAYCFCKRLDKRDDMRDCFKIIKKPLV